MMINSSTSLGVPPFQINEGTRMGIVEWTELPQEIILLISKRLTIYSDYLRFRCVCRTWNSYVAKIPLHLPPQLPWLMLSHNSFFDPSTKKIHHLNLPLSSSRICGSSFGWLVILQKRWEVRLLNPITHTTLSLPSLYTLPQFVQKPLDYNNNQFLDKIVLSSSPSLSDDFTAFTVINLSLLAFCRKGYDSWVIFDVNGYHLWMDIVSKNNLFYAVSAKGMIAVCDVEGPRVSIIETINSVNILKELYCVMFSGEDMLFITRAFLKQYLSQKERFQIFKMNWNMLNWEEVHTLGENMLFVGRMSSVSFSAADFSGCLPNRIYFSNDLYWEDDFGIFSISYESIEPLTRYPLISDHRLGCPIWVTPNPQ